MDFGWVNNTNWLPIILVLTTIVMWVVSFILLFTTKPQGPIPAQDLSCNDCVIKLGPERGAKECPRCQNIPCDKCSTIIGKSNCKQCGGAKPSKVSTSHGEGGREILANL